MAISYNEKTKMFHLCTNSTSYIIGFMGRHLVHIYWGKKIIALNSLNNAVPHCSRSCAQYNDPENPDIQADNLPLEFSVYGNTDLRTPSFHAVYEDGSSISEFHYVNHKIYDGKNGLSGLPFVQPKNDTVQSLEICLHDNKTGLNAYLVYNVFEEKNAITRSIRIENNGKNNVRIQKIMSATLDLYGMDYDLISLCGATLRERSVQRTPLSYGNINVESMRGASSHARNPFIALAEKRADETNGNVYAMSLLYSGNFTAGAYTDPYNMTRMYIGLNPFDFEWKLTPGESFTSPETVLIYSDSGIGEMSRIFHKLYRENLCRGKYATNERPILINSWETVYFDFDEEKILNIAKKAKEIGVEIMVLDDGWFDGRNDDTTSLGDWYPDTKKLPGGLSSLADKIENLGMKFGLWVEPEMISPISNLYRAHPDWCICVEGRSRLLGRNQLILDFSNPEVCEYIYNVISKILRNNKVSYLKWDMNRNMSEAGSPFQPSDRQREVAHRYILGLYSVMDRLVTEFDNVLFESCSAGGGRFDPGMLYYMPQVWTSDNTDAIERSKIQYGTSIVYPTCTMAAHISVVPNHQVHRTTDIKTRCSVAMMGQLGLELDLAKISEDDLRYIADIIVKYKEIRKTVHFGDMYRIISPFENNMSVCQFVSENKQQSIVLCVNILAEANGAFHFIKLNGLDLHTIYEDKEHNIKLSGEELMYIGFPIKNVSDFNADVYVFESTTL